jgi:hypothetical protein
MSDPSDRLSNLFLHELRHAVSARIEGGANPSEVSAYLGQRLLLLHRMQQEVALHHSAFNTGAPD